MPARPAPLPEATLAAAVDYARDRLRLELDSRLAYHDFAHTADNVVPAVARLAAGEGITGRDAQRLIVAAWFHDIGYLVRYERNESDAVALAAEVLPGLGLSVDDVAEVARSILATEVPQRPTSLAGQVLADADLFVLGTNRFASQHRALQQELAAFGRVYSDDDWVRAQIRFLTEHRYFTGTARRLNEHGKAANLAHLRSQLGEG